VNRYPEALEKFTGKTVEQARWGAKAEFEGAMELITVADATNMLDRWVEVNPVAKAESGVR
jgi:heptosyltransferase I